MTNYRINKIISALSATTESVGAGDYPDVASDVYKYKTTWGIMVASGSVGYVSMSGGGAIDISHISTGKPLPCYPLFVSCSSGTVYILG